MKVRFGSMPTALRKVASLSIRVRIFGGFAVIVMLLAGFAVSADRNIAGVADKVGDVRDASAAAVAIDQYALAVANVHQLVSNYARSERDEDLVALKASVERSDAAFATLQPHARTPEQQAVLGELKAAAESYKGVIAKSVDNISARRSGVTSFNTVSLPLNNIATALTEGTIKDGQPAEIQAGAFRIYRALQALSVGLNRYIASRNPADADIAKTELDRLQRERHDLAEKLGAGTDRPQRLLGAMEPQIAKLAAAIDVLATTTGEAVTVTQDREVLGNKLLEMSGKIRDRYLEGQTESIQVMARSVNDGRRTGLAFSVVAVLAGTLLGWLIGRSIARPVQGITAVMTTLARGELSVAIPHLARRDEIGAMAAAVQIFKEHALEVEQLRTEREEADRRAAEQRRIDMHRVADEFEVSVMRLVDTVAGASASMERSSQVVVGAVSESEQQSTVVAEAARHASANVQTVASAAEELSASLTDVNSQVTRSTETIARAAADAARTDTAAQSLLQAAERIGDVLDLIQEISGRTNLLALNATIEAARAGEAGKGFAVVASEVKALANQTGKATEDIKGQIVSIRNASQEVVQAIGAIRGIMEEVSGIASNLASSVDQQRLATGEITRSAQQVARETESVSTNIAGISSATASSNTAAAEMLRAAQELSKQSDDLRTVVDGFLARVKAA